MRIPDSKFPTLRPSLKNFISGSTSPLVAGSRYASVARRLMICDAHAASSLGDVGRHVKILRRLGVSETPVTLNGPVMLKSRRCGSIVIPSARPISVSASV